MRALLLALVAGSLLATPPAHADPYACVPPPAPGVYACAGEASAQQGSCDTTGYAYGYDTVFVFSPAILIVYAGSSCYAGPGLQQETTSVSLDAFTPVAALQLQWADARQESGSGTYDACTLQLVVGTPLGWRTVAQPCPAGAGPPDPGWGDLLP